MFELIVCVDLNNGIGKNGTIPWHNKTDLQRFKHITSKTVTNKINLIVMGNNTFKSIGRVLPDRLNVVLSKSTISNQDITNDLSKELYFNNYEELLFKIHKSKDIINKIFIIGGSNIYELFLNLRIIDTIHFSKIYESYDCDTFLKMDLIDKHFEYENGSSIKTSFENSHLDYSILRYKNKDELRYLGLLNKIITKGTYKLDRTNVGIISVFGKQLKFNVRNWRLPVYTHRKIFIRGIIEELLFFLSGNTDTTVLKNKQVNIWTGHTSREFLDSRNLTNYKEGEYGPMYGYLLRHWGYKYQGLDHDYTNKGFDQLNYVINEIKTNPTSRRILFTYWNPSVFDEQPLYCCHIMYQFYVNIEKHEISCMFTMRSNDFSLSNCFNVVSATLLLFIICKLTGYKPGKVVYTVNDCHIYLNQIDIYDQFKDNKPKNFPLCYINDFNKVEDLRYEDFNIMFYKSHPKYVIPMAI